MSVDADRKCWICGKVAAREWAYSGNDWKPWCGESSCGPICPSYGLAVRDLATAAPETRSTNRWVVVKGPSAIHVYPTAGVCAREPHLLEAHCACRPDVYEPGSTPVFPWDDAADLENRKPLRRRLIIHRMVH